MLFQGENSGTSIQRSLTQSASYRFYKLAMFHATERDPAVSHRATQLRMFDVNLSAAAITAIVPWFGDEQQP